MTTRALMPAVFIGHGSPMNTLELNRFTAAWRGLGAKLPRPRAVLSISAHWFIKSTALTAMAKPRVIHDFYGFPRELFEFDYPAPGAPEVAGEIVEVVKPSYVGLDHDSWGLDHGTWSVLAHVFPDASVPVLQLSLHAGASFDCHLELGRRLAPLRERGIPTFRALGPARAARSCPIPHAFLRNRRTCERRCTQPMRVSTSSECPSGSSK